jgi:hypothetical protein
MVVCDKRHTSMHWATGALYDKRHSRPCIGRTGVWWHWQNNRPLFNLQFVSWCATPELTARLLSALRRFALCSHREIGVDSVCEHPLQPRLVPCVALYHPRVHDGDPSLELCDGVVANAHKHNARVEVPEVGCGGRRSLTKCDQLYNCTAAHCQPEQSRCGHTAQSHDQLPWHQKSKRGKSNIIEVIASWQTPER